MKVRNYIVENYYILMDCLEEELCKNGISYVRMDNEIHFLDQIIRFFDFETDRNLIINWLFSKIEFLEIGDRFTFPNLQIIDKNSFILEVDKDSNFNDKSYQPRNKINHKRESNIVKQKLKKYSR